MRRLKQSWSDLSFEAKLGIVVMPIVLALLGGLVIPALKDVVSPPSTAVRGGIVKIVDVEMNVPLSDFRAEHASTALRARDLVLAAATQTPTPADATETPTPDETVGPDDTATPDDNLGSDTHSHDSNKTKLRDDGDGDGVPDAEDLCPTTAGNLANGCYAAYLRTQPYGCDESDMAQTL